MNVRNATPRPGPSLKGIFASSIGTLVFVIAIGLMLASWRTIDPGYVGIVFDKVQRGISATARPGWTFINPFTESITSYPVSVQTLVMVRADAEGRVQGDDSVKVGTREGQSMNADVSVQYSVESSQASNLYTAWAGAPIERIEDNLVRQVTRSVLNDVASHYGWEEIFGAKRVQYTDEVAKELTRRFGEKYVKFESLNLRGWHLPENLEKALDQKIAAQQAAEQQKYSLEQARTKAEQDKVTAEGQAQALRATAQGEADAITIRAEAQAAANLQIAQSLTPDLIRYQQILRWDGKLPIFSSEPTSFIN